MIILKIKKFTKTSKNNLYKLILFDDSTILVHEELILKNNMLLTKEIDEETIKNIDRLNNNLNAYDLAIKFISSRYHSIHEVKDYLKKKEIDKEVIDEVISKMIKQKYLDESEIEIINNKINYAYENNLLAEYTYFIKDKKKEGGNYKKVKDYIKKIDIVNSKIYLKNNITLNFEDIVNIDI